MPRYPAITDPKKAAKRVIGYRVFLARNRWVGVGNTSQAPQEVISWEDVQAMFDLSQGQTVMSWETGNMVPAALRLAILADGCAIDPTAFVVDATSIDLLAVNALDAPLVRVNAEIGRLRARMTEQLRLTPTVADRWECRAVPADTIGLVTPPAEADPSPARVRGATGFQAREPAEQAEQAGDGVDPETSWLRQQRERLQKLQVRPRP
jgi:hypothetical protein